MRLHILYLPYKVTS